MKMHRPIPLHITLRTGAAIISAICLLIITITLVGGAVFAIRVVSEVEKTYHPEQIMSMINNIGDTISSVQDTTVLLSNGEKVPIMEDFHNLILAVEHLSVALKSLDVPDVLHESAEWRNMSLHAFERLKMSLNEL